MLRRITQLWPNLIGRPNEAQEDGQQQPFVDEDQMKDLAESTLKVYGKDYWSRLIPLEGFLMGQQERYLIGPDMVQEVDAMYRIDIDTIPDWHPRWDPMEFQQLHP